MHGFEEATAAPPDDPTDRRPWYQLLNRYHWFVLVVAALGWLFDCLDQQLFILARPQAMAALLNATEFDESQVSLLRKIGPIRSAVQPAISSRESRLFWTNTFGDIAT